MERTNSQQDTLATQPLGNVLALAPAGCGKTEALARRAQVLLSRGDITAPRMVLALTFSNKACDNLAGRLRQVVGPSWRRRVTVTNFHGLAARVLRAHASVIGLPRDFKLPEDPWRRRVRRELGIGYSNAGPFETALRESKNGPFDDDDVMARLEDSGCALAVDYERLLRQDGRLDHDDLLRHLARILLVADVRALYRAHFAVTLVDEVQDLSLLQYDIVRGIAGDTVTYVGDPAQGIYTFAGADPVGVFDRIHALAPAIVEFTTSYRSSPSVLCTVNAVARVMGTTALTCGSPQRWPKGSDVLYLERQDTEAEAQALLTILGCLLSENAETSIVVIFRRGTRVAHFRNALVVRDLPFEDWSMPTHVPQIVSLLRRFIRQANATAGSPLDRLAVLDQLCRSALGPGDASSCDELASACASLQDLLEEGLSLPDAVARCRSSATPGRSVAGGLHLLNAHKGKGQEFDWVVVMGLEEGQIPDFRSPEDPEELRVLHVMISRAKRGLVLTYSRNVMTTRGWRATPPSRWLRLLRDTATISDVA